MGEKTHNKKIVYIRLFTLLLQISYCLIGDLVLGEPVGQVVRSIIIFYYFDILFIQRTFLFFISPSKWSFDVI